jgi:signal transduction histidine kinase/CheY-like chemotaxis protein
MAIEPHQIDEQIYFSLSVQISSALHESNTMQSLEKTIRSLETAKNKISENLTVIQQKTSQLEDSNRKLSRLDQLKNDFIANVTHDFRSPLMVILNLADLSIKYYDEMDDRLILDRLQTVFNASERLKDTVDRLLEIAKMDASAMELHIRNLPLRAYIKNISDFYKSAAAASSIEIIAQLPKHEIDDFYTDPEKLDEIVNNIISNAIKFVDPMSGKILIKVIDGEKHVRLVIEDNGIGIPPDKLETIFNRFKQLEGGRTAKHKGSGIGLAFARQAAASLEGTLKAESDGPGKGARFILKFPKGIDVFKHSDGKIIFDPQEGKISNDKRSQYKHLIESGLHESRERREVQVIMNSPRSEDRSDPSRVLILIIDENPAITKIVREYLSRAGYGNFIIASCASDGLEAVSRFKPDLIISDCSIPLATGREFHQELLDNPELLHTPIIFLSANAGKRLSPEEKKRGTFVYLQKPVDGKELLLKVEQFLAEKHGSS